MSPNAEQAPPSPVDGHAIDGRAGKHTFARTGGKLTSTPPARPQRGHGLPVAGKSLFHGAAAVLPAAAGVFITFRRPVVVYPRRHAG
ncbi:MAG: hypothetical protein JOY82_27595 [Streptosporangiaceae bacterium]|nr:hypothetical protein [Streptosporangiaceae bacterium]